MALTDYERGKLTLQAFSLMDGWGVNNERGVHVPHHLEKRKDLARELVEWAIKAPAETTEGK